MLELAESANIDPQGDRSELERILGNKLVSTLFQPIVLFPERKVLGYEALSRGPADSPLHNPVKLFNVAHHFGRLLELEFLCRESAIRNFHRLQLPGRLFLNVIPNVLLEHDHRPGRTVQLLQQLGLEPDRIVIELTEQYPIYDYEILRAALSHYHSMGFSTAIDDFGSGYSGLRLWSEIRPDFVKLDRHFISDIHNDPVKQEFVRSIQEIALGIQCMVIAEGIETPEEYHTICSLGIGLGQGYHFARPHELPAKTVELCKFECNDPACNLVPYRLSDTIASLIIDIPCVSPQTSVSDVAELFSTAYYLHSIPVVNQGRPVGVIRRTRLMELFISRYGRELHGKKAISFFMDNSPLIVEHSMPVEEVSQKITESMHMDPELDFIICKDGNYAGMGRLMDLLKKITELQIRNASYSNPLTMLPGNVPIYETIDSNIQNGTAFVIAYCDLDNFKPYNDVYGYSKGDMVIKHVARILTEEVDPRLDFIGHIGGDDFIIIFKNSHWEAACKRMLARFEQEVPDFYSQQDRQQSGLWNKDRQGKEAFFPLLSLSIGVVEPSLESCHSHHDVAALATEAKKQAKQIQGNSLFLDRRCRCEVKLREE
jgi:diguanylate cyclase (GGDEF)-like protein